MVNLDVESQVVSKTLCRTDNQVKNRWHSALEKMVKNGKTGLGISDLEFEAEALRRVESERRLLVTPTGEELVIAFFTILSSLIGHCA